MLLRVDAKNSETQKMPEVFQVAERCKMKKDSANRSYLDYELVELEPGFFQLRYGLKGRQCWAGEIDLTSKDLKNLKEALLNPAKEEVSK